MRNLELLSKKKLTIILIFLIYNFSTSSEEPADIWNNDSKNNIEENIAIENSDEKTISQNKKVGRNDKCICGSGKKSKHCCGSI